MLGLKAPDADADPDDVDPDPRMAPEGAEPVLAKARVVRWDDPKTPTRAELEEVLREEDLVPWITRDGPDVSYGEHTHEHDEVRVIVRGRLRFRFPDGDEVVLGPGDRVDLPRGLPHGADVADPEGVEYLCATRE